MGIGQSKTDVCLAETSITFDVDTKIKLNTYTGETVDLTSYIQKRFYQGSSKGHVLFSHNEALGNIKAAAFGNGLLGTAVEAYNQHYHLILSPDDVWISIALSLARYVDAHAERMRHVFVTHSGQKELVVYGSGTIFTANYQSLVDQLNKHIQKNTKADIKAWIECNFSTTTDHTRLISQIVCMAAMKHYFSYKMVLSCGLPKVTLRGTKYDWETIIEKLSFLRSLNEQVLTEWSKVLEYVLTYFVDAFDNKIDPDFWNRIAHVTGGGSGPSYVEGWILAFFPFDKETKYCLNSIDTIKEGSRFGHVETGDVASCSVTVPVIIDDNGRIYNTEFLAGLLATEVINNGLEPLPSWALIDMG